MKAIRALEDALCRLEGAIAVGLVCLMLGLAGYNVLYRNVLVPLQKYWAHSGPVISPAAPTTTAQPAVALQVEQDPAGAGGAAPAGAGTGGAGFGGDWGEGGVEPAAATGAASVGDSGAGTAGAGFGGDWGEPESSMADAADNGTAAVVAATDEPPAANDVFDNLPDIAPVAPEPIAEAEPQGGPPTPGSFAAIMVDWIDRVKLPWIDVILRQLVIMVSLLGASLATVRHKHINVDAVGRLVRGPAKRVLALITNGLALGVCLVLAGAGLKLAENGRAYPKALVDWADEWTFQLMFPIGFALLAFHFAVRMAEVISGDSKQQEAA